MKIKISIILILMILISSYSYIKKENNDLSEFNLKGKVKSVREFTYENIDNLEDIQKNKPSGKFVVFYNIKGNLTKRYSYHSDGRLVVNNIYKYDNEGFLIERIIFTLGEMDFRYTFKYDEKGNKIEMTCYNSDGSLNDKTTYKYDIKDNQVEIIMYNSNEKLEEKSEYTYNDKDIKMDGKLELFKPDGSLDFSTIYNYDEKGNKIELYSYESNRNFRNNDTFKYDDKGNLIEFISLYPNGNVYSKDTYKYDEKGNQIEKITFNSNSEIKENITTKYDYDENENWVKKNVYSNKTLLYIKERKIEYYE